MDTERFKHSLTAQIEYHKAISHILVTPLPIVAAVSDVQPLNRLLPRVVTLSGNDTVSSKAQLLKALSTIVVTLVTVTVFKFAGTLVPFSAYEL